MKVIIGESESPEAFQRVIRLIAASALYDVQLNGHNCHVERGERTCVELEGFDRYDAEIIMSAVWITLREPSYQDSMGRSITAFGVRY